MVRTAEDWRKTITALELTGAWKEVLDDIAELEKERDAAEATARANFKAAIETEDKLTRSRLRLTNTRVPSRTWSRRSSSGMTPEQAAKWFRQNRGKGGYHPPVDLGPALCMDHEARPWSDPKKREYYRQGHATRSFGG